MRLDAVKILGINITTNSKKQILEEVQKFLLQNPKSKILNPKSRSRVCVIVTPNPEQIMLASHDIYFSEMLNRADVSLPDGIGISYALRLLDQKVKGKTVHAIPGIEFMENLIFLAAKRGVSTALIGGRDGLAVKALDCLSKLHPKLRNSWAVDVPEIEISGHELQIKNYGENVEQKQNGKNSASIPVATIRKERYFERLVDEIREKKTQIIFVGLGAPKQEYFIEEIASHLSSRAERGDLDSTGIASSKTSRNDMPIVLMSVGGSFDEIAGAVPRPPRWISQIGFKWLWRLIFQPWRVVRQLALLKFVALIARERYSLK